MIAPLIKNNTRLFHENLEIKLKDVLFNENLSPLAYYNLLLNFKTAYLSLENSLKKNSFIEEMLFKRSKIHMLDDDLFCLEKEIGLKTHQISTLEYNTTSTANALGAMYVMEGATLGGQIIVKFLSRHPWMQSIKCYNFFKSYGKETGNMWKEFIEFIEDYVEMNPEDSEKVVEGAIMAFKHIDKTLTV
ncbi:biliverdin-producing heme oxygenase [Abyssalbus ytuae]|uniref:Biliverdin-producing heme oxygenase n=1 Tax=Abyssalbus ytuae TaxID=2926907 RepID=A0A9E6ZUI4_9FLAO|nr:biliverdin-producing heme oxygenase [Abyssalbus ytuae]UOB19173.1 biliverdin-producing heme oxygenase [Abyssalbus ytuae]